MPEMTEYQPGVPCWADMTANDLAGAVRFYGELFGWDAEDQGADAGHYTIVSKGGKQVAGIGTQYGEAVPPRWTTYIAVGDADQAVGRAEAAGGKVLAEPMDVMEAGRMAVLADPTGAVIAAWQAGRHLGAQLVNEPGSVVWNELSTSDLQRARAFYTEVFGWGWAGSDEYAEIRVGGRTVGGAMPRPPAIPPEVPDHWLVYFASADLEADVQRATGLGATTVAGPTELPGVGRFAVLADPQGAVFALFTG